MDSEETNFDRDAMRRLLKFPVLAIPHNLASAILKHPAVKAFIAAAVEEELDRRAAEQPRRPRRRQAEEASDAAHA